MVVVASAGLWAVIGWLCIPLLVHYGTGPADVWSLFRQVTVVVLAWGIAIGGWLVLSWWTEAEFQSGPPDFADVTGIPRDFYHPSTNSDGGQLPEPGSDELKGLVLGVEWQETHR